MWQVFFYFLQLVNVNIPVFDINSSSMPVSGQHCLFGRRGVSLRKLMAAGGWSFFDDVKRELECCICQEQFNETWELKILICLVSGRLAQSTGQRKTELSDMSSNHWMSWNKIFGEKLLSKKKFIQWQQRAPGDKSPRTYASWNMKIMRSLRWMKTT